MPVIEPPGPRPEDHARQLPAGARVLQPAAARADGQHAAAGPGSAAERQPHHGAARRPQRPPLPLHRLRQGALHAVRGGVGVGGGAEGGVRGLGSDMKPMGRI